MVVKVCEAKHGVKIAIRANMPRRVLHRSVIFAILVRPATHKLHLAQTAPAAKLLGHHIQNMNALIAELAHIPLEMEVIAHCAITAKLTTQEILLARTAPLANLVKYRFRV